MALRNGLLVHGPTSWAAAARAPGGAIDVASGNKPTFPGPASSMPLLRGPLRLAEGFAFIPLARRRAPLRPPAVRGRAGDRGGDRRRPSPVPRFAAARVPVALRETLAAGLGLMPALVALRGSRPRRLPRRRAQGDRRLRAAAFDPREVAKEHERCGSHLVAPMLVFSLAGQLIVERLIENPGRVARGLAALAGVSARGRALRLVRAPSRHPLARAFRRPGYGDPAPIRHPRADRGAARGRRRGAGRDPAGGGSE